MSRSAMTARPSLHLHAVLGLKDGSVRGGHFVRQTLEVTIRETAAALRRMKHGDLGIALISV
jgi:predicted DNA-binding protein with PD1-like motif